jgi:phage baseplate assembly protein W
MSSRMNTRKWLGKGWGLPLVPGITDKQLPYVEGPEKVRQSIWIILETEPGERLMRPHFGCGLRRYLMKPNTSANRALMKRDVERTLKAWEPRIRLESVSVDAGDEPSLVLIHIHYTHIRDGSLGNLVYPYYLE